MNTTDKEVVATLVKSGRKDLARAYLGEVKKGAQPVATAKTFTAKDLNAMPARTTIVLDDGTLWKHPKGHWVAENYWGGRAEPTLNEALEKVNKSRHQQVRSNHQTNVSPKRSAPGLTSRERAGMEKTDKEVVATLLKANRRDLARAYVREVTTAKKDPTKTMKVALNDAKMTLDGLASRDPAYRPLVKKFKSLSDEIFKALKDRG